MSITIRCKLISEPLTLVHTELQKSYGYAGITREEGFQNGQSVKMVSCQHIT